MAAFMDGEGNLQVNPYKGRRAAQVRILIGNTDANLALWLRRTFGGNVCIRNNRKYNPKAKTSYIWSCTAGRAAWILHNSIPWLLLKSAQAELLMELQTNIDLTRQGRGKHVSDEVFEYRRSVHVRIKELNAKGCAAEKPILSLEELNHG